MDLLTKHLGAMSRTVKTFDHEGRPARAVIAWRRYDTDAADLWDAITQPGRLARWFAPVTGELREGGRYQIEGNASGSITRCDAPRTIELTWEARGEVSWVTVRVAAEGATTKLTVEHVAHVPEELWQQFGPGAVGIGWEIGLYALGRYLSDPKRFTVPAELDPAWTASPEARTFYRGASAGWGSASIESGTPRDQALAAAELTRRMFSGEAGA